MESVTDIKADINKKYRCVSGKQISLHNVTLTLRDATIQAYLSNGNFSREGEDHPGPAPVGARGDLRVLGELPLPLGLQRRLPLSVRVD